MEDTLTRSIANIDAGKCLFTYAVIADTHLNEDEDNTSNSPFNVNRLTNRRLRYVIDDLNKRDLALVFHLGDVVHPVPSMGQLYADSAARFHEQMEILKHPLHVIPGNHDVGDKHTEWGPAGIVNDTFLKAWTKHFGDHYFKVKHDDITFIGINAQLVGSGLDMEQEQKIWLESSLQELDGDRIYLFTHYPPFLTDTDEPEHYDNLSKAGRSWLLALLDKYNVEALFAGHVHHFWYNQIGDCQCYLLPSTAFTRQDYAEMFRVEPADEFGRNDEKKLGYLLVHVHEQGHFIEMVRCYGKEKGEFNLTSDKDEVSFNKPLSIVNPITNKAAILGFDLRQDWAEMVQIPPSGGLDEFDRKWVRNDYALLALLEMGAKNLRIPFADIKDLKRQQRLQDLKKLGFEFTLFSFGLPEEAFNTELAKVISTLINSWEISWSVEKLDELKASFIRLPADFDCQLSFSPLRSKADIMKSGRTYYHVINHGYTTTDNQLSDLITETIDNNFSGYVFRCGFEDSIWESITLVAETNKKTKLHSSIHLRITVDNPAENQVSESFICRRLAEAIVYGWLHKVDNIFCDTLATSDRGHFPREGVLDRLYNPKQGYYVIKHFHAFLSSIDSSLINTYTIESDEKTGNTLLQVELEEGVLIFIISSSKDWLKRVVTQIFTNSESKFQRLNWFLGELEVLTSADSFLIDNEYNSVEGLNIELLVSKVD